MIIAFAPKHNRTGINPKTGKPWRDASGAFIPEAKKFLAFHKQPASYLYLIDNTTSFSKMEDAVVNVLRLHRRDRLDGVAFFCHGLKNRIQFGFAGGQRLAAELAEVNARPSVRVTFYACDAGRDDDKDRKDDLSEFGGDNGFADKVRDALCERSLAWCSVDSHTTAAHTTRNPHVRRFEGLGVRQGGAGGYYIVPRGSKLWQPWIKALRTSFRFQYPYLMTSEILQRLEHKK